MKKHIKMTFLMILISVLAIGGCKSETTTYNPLGLMKLLEGNTVPHTVTYNGNGSDDGIVPVDAGVYTKGQTVTVLAKPTGLVKTGYTFTCWNTHADGSGANYYLPATFRMGSTDVVLYAIWTSAINYYVSLTGSDTLNDGLSETAPFKTITHAVSMGTNIIIKAAPGIYSAATNGETVPVTMLSGQTLIGDIATAGQGAGTLGTTTEIKCSNNTASGGVFTAADSCLVLANNTTVKGFIFGNTYAQNFVFGVFSPNGLTVNVSNNTFDGNLYGGIYFYSGSLTSKNNDFYVFSYGYYLDNPGTSPVLIDHNIVREFCPLPCMINTGSSNMIISNNTITGNGQGGIYLNNADAIVENNTFNGTGGYTYGAISCYYSSPKIRGNTFTGTNGIYIGQSAGDTSNPDMGTAIDPGNNNFASAAGYAIHLLNSAITDIYAIGNTWPGNDNPPTTSDIVNDASATAKIWYGTGASDYR